MSIIRVEGHEIDHRFNFGDSVRVKFRNIDRYWKGMVHKDEGGEYVEVIKDGFCWEPTKVERDRIKHASDTCN